jgi:hypothetical protein
MGRNRGFTPKLIQIQREADLADRVRHVARGPAGSAADTAVLANLVATAISHR